MSIDEVNRIANSRIRKYDWHTEEHPRGIKLIVTDGLKVASVWITTGEDIDAEITRLIEAVDAHEYKDLDAEE